VVGLGKPKIRYDFTHTHKRHDLGNKIYIRNTNGMIQFTTFINETPPPSLQGYKQRPLVANKVTNMVDGSCLPVLVACVRQPIYSLFRL
jgi:hypothetical protein